MNMDTLTAHTEDNTETAEETAEETSNKVSIKIPWTTVLCVSIFGVYCYRVAVKNFRLTSADHYIKDNGDSVIMVYTKGRKVIKFVKRAVADNA